MSRPTRSIQDLVVPSVRVGKGLSRRVVMRLYDYSKFSFSDLSKTAWDPKVVWDSYVKKTVFQTGKKTSLSLRTMKCSETFHES